RVAFSNGHQLTKGVAVKATISGLGALLLAAVVSSLAHAQGWYPSCPLPQAPDACGPGDYCTNPYGQAYGPNYWVRPPFEPVNGLRPSFQGFANNVRFPTHPFARGPRDFFMVD